MRGSVWVASSGIIPGSETEIVLDSATITWATADGKVHGSATAVNTGTTVSDDIYLTESQTSGRIVWALDPGCVGVTLDPNGWYILFRPQNYSPVSGTLTVTVHRA